MIYEASQMCPRETVDKSQVYLAQNPQPHPIWYMEKQIIIKNLSWVKLLELPCMHFCRLVPSQLSH